MAETARRYRFGPLERRGVLLGLRGTQVAIVVVAAFLVLLDLNLIGAHVLALVVGAVVVLAAAVIDFVPVSGRTMEEWMPIALTWARRRLRGEHRWTSVEPLTGRTSTAEAAADMPPYLAGLEIIGAPANDGQLGVIKDANAHTYTGALQVSGRSFALLDADEKERLLEGWGSVLAGLAREGGAIRRVQWIERALPEDADAIGRHLRRRGTEPADSPVVQSYLRLINNAGSASQQHETLLVVQVDGHRTTRENKAAGGDVDQGACSVLLRELEALASRLAGAEVVVEGALTPSMLARSIRIAIDPEYRNVLATGGGAGAQRIGVSPRNAWPLVSQVHWSALQTEGAWHATYWVSEWPRIDVGPDWLSPLLLQSRVTRTVGVTMEPVPPMRAARDVERDRTSDLSDTSMRAKAGFRSSARRQRQTENVERREQELADGHTDYRFSSYVTITANNEDELEVACHEIEQLSQQSRLQLRRLYGEQDVAMTFTLPLCDGLR